MPDSKTPDEPFDDIIEMFRNIAENGAEPTRAPAAASAPVARNDSAADASVLGEAASAQESVAATPAAIPVEPRSAAPAEPKSHAKVTPVVPEPVKPTESADPAASAASAATAEPAQAGAHADPGAVTEGVTEGVVPMTTIEKLLAPTPRTAPTPTPYVGVPKPDLADTTVHSEPDALAAVINGTAAPAAAPEPVVGDDVVLTAALARPGSVPPRALAPVAGGGGRRRRRGVVIVAGIAAVALLAVGGAYALERHSPSKTASDTTHQDTIGAPVTLDSTPTPTPTPTQTASETAKHKRTHKPAAVVPPSIAVPTSVPTVAPSTNPAASASQSAALASASASLSAAIVAKEQQQAKHYAALISTYYKTVAPLAQGFAGVTSTAPTISPKDTASASDANAFYSAVTKASHYYNAVRAVKAPSTLAGAQSRLLAAMASARSNLINGQNVALNAQNCSSDTCTYGTQRGWAAYTSTLSRTWSFPQAALTWQTAVAKVLKG